MTTLTIDVSPEVLGRAKAKAAALNTTIERVVEESISGLAGSELSQTEILRQLEAWSVAHPFTVDLKSFTREELNQR